MVRLEGSIERAIVRLCAVSIPLWFDWKECVRNNFKGRWAVSIPLWFDWKRNRQRKLPHGMAGFNSIMVRLEACFEPHRQHHVSSFNSIMVRLEVFDPGLFIRFFASFNSIMVRLEEVAGSDEAFLAGFQFHYGSIGRILTALTARKMCSVSIPLWFDWKISASDLKRSS